MESIWMISFFNWKCSKFSITWVLYLKLNHFWWLKKIKRMHAFPQARIGVINSQLKSYPFNWIPMMITFLHLILYVWNLQMVEGFHVCQNNNTLSLSLFFLYFEKTKNGYTFHTLSEGYVSFTIHHLLVSFVILLIEIWNFFENYNNNKRNIHKTF